MSTEARDVAERMVKCVISGDVGGAMECVHPDVVIHEPEALPYGGDWHGRTGFQEMFAAMTAALDFSLDHYEVTALGPESAMMRAEVTFTGRASHRQLTTKIVEIYTVQAGMIVDADIYPKDTLAVCALVRS
jgi:uncharacterized protein